MLTKYVGDDFVILKTAARREKSVGGIVIPDSAQEAVTSGDCIAAGINVVGLYEGDVVTFLPNAGTEMLIQGETVRVVHKDQVVCASFASSTDPVTVKADATDEIPF